MATDGKRKNPLPPPEIKKVKSPILEDAGEPGGPHTPGARKKRRKKKARFRRRRNG